MLKQFRALPAESRVREMKERDYLWCLVNHLLDKEEELDRLCPACRARAMKNQCPVCGRAAEQWGEGMDNPAFDRSRFEELKGGAQ